MATTSWPTLSASESPSAAVGRSVAVDLDDGEVGQRVDAVDRAGEDAAVLELDVELVAALDDVVVGEDPAVAVVDDAGADAGLGDDAEVAGVAVPVTVIRTTAGLTLAATSMVADDSSMVTGLTAPTVAARGRGGRTPGRCGRGRRSRRGRGPCRPRRGPRTGAPTATTGPPPVRRERRSARRRRAGAGSAAGSNQRSGVGSAAGASYVRDPVGPCLGRRGVAARPARRRRAARRGVTGSAGVGTGAASRA